MRSLFLVLTLSSSAVLAQAGALQLSFPAQAGDTLTVGGPAVDCGLARTVNWTLNTTSQVCSDLQLWLTSASSCPDAPASGDVVFSTVTQANLNPPTSQRTGQPTFTVGQLPAFQGTGATPCGEQGRRIEFRACGTVKVLNAFTFACDSTVKASPLKVAYDTEAPTAPTLEVAGLDMALNVRVAGTGGSPSQLRVEVRREGLTDPVASVTQSVDRPQFRISGLENGVTYQVTAFALDAAGNVSPASEVAQGTPVKTLGFFERYVEAGGEEAGGCGAAGGGPLVVGAMLAALGFWLSSRRNRS